MVDRDRDQLVKRLEENGQSRVPPPITQAFPVEVSDEFGERRGATIVTLNEPRFFFDWSESRWVYGSQAAAAYSRCGLTSDK